MTVGKFNHEEVIKIATLIEERGYKLYTTCAEKVKDEFAKNILLFLADQEKRHKEDFERLHKRMIDNGSFIQELDPETAAYLNALAGTYVFPEDEKDFTASINSMDDVLACSMQAEKESILLYTELTNNAYDKESSALFKSLAEEEKKHLVKLQELMQLIEERGIYY